MPNLKQLGVKQMTPEPTYSMPCQEAATLSNSADRAALTLQCAITRPHSRS